MIVFTHELVAAIIATGTVATAIGTAFACHLGITATEALNRFAALEGGPWGLSALLSPQVPPRVTT